MKKQNKKWEIIILSPHMDDAILSLGQHILRWKRENKKIKIINIFTRFKENSKIPDYTKEYIKKSGFDSIEEFQMARRQEEREVMKKLKITYENWNLVDAGFRGIYNERQKLLGGKISQKDKNLESSILEKIKRIDCKLLILPMGIGGHVDHLIVKKIGEKAKAEKMFYLENPYLWENLNFIKCLKYLFKINSILMGKRQRRILEIYRSQFPLWRGKKKYYMEIVVKE